MILKNFLRDLNFLMQELSRVLLSAILIVANRLIIAMRINLLLNASIIFNESILRNKMYHKFLRVNSQCRSARCVCNIRIKYFFV